MNNNNNITNEPHLPPFPHPRKYPIIKSTNLPGVVVPSNPSTIHNSIKIPRANFNKTTGMFINFKKRTNSNFNERESPHNNQDEYIKPSNDIPKPKRLVPTEMNHVIKVRSSESNENIRSIQQPSKGLGNTYYHRALIPIGVGSSSDINCVNSGNNVSKPRHAHNNEENNDSFINELEDILTGVSNKGSKNEEVKNALNAGNADNNGDDEQQQVPDPRINFEQINEVNKSRPQTSYGGLNARRKKLQIALKSAKYRTSNNNNIDK